MMSKRSSQSKDRRRAERERQQRWGKQQKALREKQILGDMQYFVDNGFFDTEARQQEAVAQSLQASQDWRSEPEFADLAFDLYLNQRALQQAWHEMEFDPEAFRQLSEDDQADENFELRALAIERMLTPEFKKQFHARLERFRIRLRQQRQWEPLAKASMVQLMLEKDAAQDASTWPECLLVFQLHTEAVERYIELQDAAEAALTQALQGLGKATGDELSADELEQLEVILQAADRTTPGLLEFLDRSTGEAFDEALQALRDSIFFFNLFSPEETNAFTRRFVAALVNANPQHTNPEDLAPEEAAAVDDAISQAVAVYLDELDTPQRRAELYELARTRLAETATQAEDPLSGQAELLLQLLEDDALPLADNDFFQAALMGETDFHFQLAARQQDGDTRDLDDDQQPGAEP
jgi:hypothetical protein